MYVLHACLAARAFAGHSCGDRLIPGGIAFVSLLVDKMSGVAFVSLLADKTGVKQDTALPFSSEITAYVVTTTFNQQGNLLVACQAGTTWQLISYLPNGTRNATFGLDGVAQEPLLTNGRPTAMAVDSVGRIVVVGTSQVGSDAVFTTVRYTSTGVIEQVVQVTAFTPGDSSALGVEVHADNSIVVTGFRTVSGNPIPAVITYTADLVQIAATSYPTFVPGYVYGVKDIDGIAYYVGSAFDRALVGTLVSDSEVLLIEESEELPFIIHRVGVRQDIVSPFDAVPLRISRLVGWMNYLLYDNDKIVLSGSYDDILTLIRYDLNAQRDTTFGTYGVVQIPDLDMTAGYAVEKDALHNYYFAGESLVDGVSVFTFGSVTSNGDVRFVVQETSLGAGKAFTVVCNEDGTVFVGGETMVDGVFMPTLIKYTYEGKKITSFAKNGVAVYSQFGRGYLSSLEVIDENTISAVGKMGNCATLMQFRIKLDRLEQVRHGF